MIPFVIPKTPVDSPELDLGVSSKGKVGVKQEGFNSILATYLGKIEGEVDSNSRLPEASSLTNEEEKHKKNGLIEPHVPLTFLHLDFLVCQEVVEKPEVEVTPEIVGGSGQSQLIAEDESVREVELPGYFQESQTTDATGPIANLVDQRKIPVESLVTPAQSSFMTPPVAPPPQSLMTPPVAPPPELLVTPSVVSLGREDYSSWDDAKSVDHEQLVVTELSPHPVLEGFEPFTLDDALVQGSPDWGLSLATGPDRFPRAMRTTAEGNKQEEDALQLSTDVSNRPLIESEAEMTIGQNEVNSSNLEAMESIIVEKSPMPNPLEHLAYQPQQVAFSRVAPQDEQSSFAVRSEAVPEDAVTNSIQESNSSEVLEVTGHQEEVTENPLFEEPSKEVVVEKPKRAENVVVAKDLHHAGEIQMLVKPPQTDPVNTVAKVQSKPVLDLQASKTVIPKLTEQIQSLVREERTEVRIQLKPEHLGELKIKLSLERGIMMAEFVVENEAVREVIASQLPQLQTALQEQGANVAEMMVNVGFGQGKRDHETPARPRQANLQNRGQLQSGSVSGSPYLGKNPWNQVDLRA